MDTDLILLDQFIKKHPMLAARILEGLPDEEVSPFIDEMPMDLSIRLISSMNVYKVSRCLKLLKLGRAVELLEKSDLEKVELWLRQLDQDSRDTFLDRISSKKAGVLRPKLEYPDHTVGARMLPLEFLLRKDMVVKDVLKALKREQDINLLKVCVVNEQGTLEGIIRLQDLLTANKTDEIERLMVLDIPKFQADLTIESIKDHPVWLKYRSIPVVDSNEKLIGVLKFESTQLIKWEPGREHTKQVMETSNALGELYWIGLTAFLHSVSK